MSAPRSLLVALLATVLAATPAHAQSVGFTWRMVGGYDAAVPEMRPDSPGYDQWRAVVTLDRAWCGDRASFNRPARRIDACRYEVAFPERGRHALSVRVGAAEATREIDVKGRLVVVMGDSIASGEGVREKTGWKNKQCHRSALSAPSLAALRLQRADPTTPVTFISVACSGATITRGLLGEYAGIERGKPLMPQVDAISEIARRRDIDALLISVGANDLHFSKVVKACMPLPRFRRGDCFARRVDFDRTAPTLSAAVTAAATRLKNSYAVLARRLEPIVSSDQVYLMEYFDPTRGTDGNTCGDILGIRTPILERARLEVILPLNRLGRTAATDHGWHYVSGVQQLFARNGFCARPSWVISLGDSLDRQLGIDGTLHPNGLGHAAISAKVSSLVGETWRYPQQEGGDIPDSATTALVTGGAAVGLVAGLVGWLTRRRRWP